MALQKTVRINAVNVKPTSKADIYEIACDDNNEYATFDVNIARAARALIGQTVNMEYVEKQKGQYVNLYCEGVSAVNGFQQQPEFTQAPANTASPDRELRIMRQTAAKVGVLLLPFLPDHEQTPTGLLAIADYLVDYFVEGAPLPAQIQQAFTTAAFVSSDDIPF